VAQLLNVGSTMCDCMLFNLKNNLKKQNHPFTLVYSFLHFWHLIETFFLTLPRSIGFDSIFGVGFLFMQLLHCGF
jgi:hypothetical protein